MGPHPAHDRLGLDLEQVLSAWRSDANSFFGVSLSGDDDLLTPEEEIAMDARQIPKLLVPLLAALLAAACATTADEALVPRDAVETTRTEPNGDTKRFRHDGRGNLVHMSDADFAAVVAYLRQLPPVTRELPATTLRFVGRGHVAHEGGDAGPIRADAGDLVTGDQEDREQAHEVVVGGLSMGGALSLCGGATLAATGR